MTPVEILDEARRQGLELRAAEGGKLRWRCRGALPPNLRQQMTAHKAALLVLLQSAAGNKAETSVDCSRKTGHTDETRDAHESGVSPDFPLSLETELILEKKVLKDKIRTCHDPELRRRLENLHVEEPQHLAAALDWHDRLLALGEAWRSDQARFETLRAAWDQAEADRLLAHLRAEMARIERQKYCGRFPPALANIVADGFAIAHGYVRNHEQEAARGWDAMKLLRDIVSSLLCIARGDRRFPTRTTLAVPGK